LTFWIGRATTLANDRPFTRVICSPLEDITGGMSVVKKAIGSVTDLGGLSFFTPEFR
jgi:hypothetical protein